MRFAILFVAILSMLFAYLANAGDSKATFDNPDKGWRTVKRIQCCPEELVPRFAEYENDGCVDLEGKGGKEKSYADFMPIYRKCYNIGKDTVSIYHERGFMSQMWLYPEYGCKGKPQHETDWSACQPVERNWHPNVVRSFMID